MRISLPTFPRPEVQLTAGNTVVVLSGNNTAVLGLALRQGYLQLTGTGCLARNNLVGMTADGRQQRQQPHDLRHRVRGHAMRPCATTS